MIHQIEVDGFRSLENFSMQLNHGLNILIGPNGSGKTNIISFFQFISRMITRNIKDAISLSGGVGSVFRKETDTEYKTVVTAKIRGAVYCDESFFMRSPSTIAYEYAFQFAAPKGFEDIIYVSQNVKVKSISRKDTSSSPPRITDGSWDFEIDFNNQELFGPSISFIRRDISKYSIRRNDTNLLDEAISLYKIQETETQRFSLYCLLSIVDDLPVLWAVRNDMNRGDILNIDPGKIRILEDIGSRPGIQSDGSGLAATLNHLQRDDPRSPPLPFVLMTENRSMPSRPKEGWKSTLSQIKRLAELVNDQIDDIFVEPDHFDNTLRLKVRLKGERQSFALSALSLSDGTLKWISLVTAILTHRTMFAIEEPENFLHPQMQKEVIQLMRETTRTRNSFAVMSTHSETILNSAIPHEIIVIRASNSLTRSNRIADPDRLSHEINQTGFGLGSYYIAGDLDDA